MERFEHTRTREWDEVLALGNEGWELVAVTSENGESMYYLKREEPPLRDRVTLEQREAALRKSIDAAGDPS